MDPPFTQEGIKRIEKTLKNNKATGRDGVNAELIKYGTGQLYSKIANLFNKTNETGNYPEEIRGGILTPFSEAKKERRTSECVSTHPSFGAQKAHCYRPYRQMLGPPEAQYITIASSVSRWKINYRTSILPKNPR